MTTKRRPEALEKRMREIQRELSLVNSDIKTLAKALDKPDRPVDMSKLKSVRNFPAPEMPAQEIRRPAPPVQPAPLPVVDSSQSAPEMPGGQNHPRSVYDVRFKDYLASSFEAQAIRPLRRERDMQKRNAIIMMTFLALLILVILAKYWPF